MIHFLVVVVSCAKNRALWPDILNRGKLLILCGGAEETHLDGSILYLKCNDAYDGLPEKMMAAFEFIHSTAAFDSFTHVLKADDHDTEFTANQIIDIQEKYTSVFLNHDYVGQQMWPRCGAPTWHFNKVPITSKWHNKAYTGPSVPFLAGGQTYVLSRKALDLLVKHKEVHHDHIMEDVMISLILNSYGIYPYQLDYGIRHWQG
jgi:hypothetical protein